MTEKPQSTSTLQSIASWFLPPEEREFAAPEMSERFDWYRAMPYFALHLACLTVFLVGWSWTAVGVALLLHCLRVFTLTGFYHRYFSHRAFKTSRSIQFLFAFIGCTAIQRGPLWWAAHHRHHHTHSDDPDDLHSPRQKGTIWSHTLWFLTPRAYRTNLRLIPDFAKYWELRLIDRLDLLPPVLLGLFLYGFGELLALGAPDWEVTGWQLVVWGVLISTITAYQVTYLVNSATHLVGSRRYETKDDSKNSLIIALLTFGEGWHNNHHHYPNSTRQGFFWWEIDITYYILKCMSLFGLVWDLKPVPQRLLEPKPQTTTEGPIPAEGEPAVAGHS